MQTSEPDKKKPKQETQKAYTPPQCEYSWWPIIRAFILSAVFVAVVMGTLKYIFKL